MIDYAVISPVLARSVELRVDSISHVTMTTQLRPPAMPWKPEHDKQNLEWNRASQLSRFVVRQQLPCFVLKASLVFQTFGAISSFLQPTVQNWLKRLSAILEPSARHAVATRLIGRQSATLVGNHSVWKTQVSRDKRHRPIFLERCGHVGLPRAVVAHCSPQVFTHWCSVEATHFHAACDTQGDDFGRLP